MRGGSDLTRALEPPPDAELFEFDLQFRDGSTARLGAVCINSRTDTEEGLALLVPGYTGSRDDFYGLLGPLADRGFSVVAYSQRGQLGSSGPGGFGPCLKAPGYTLGDFVGDLLQVSSELSRGTHKNRIHLLGHSFGGLVGMATVLQQPETFSSYTHWNSGPRSRQAHGGHLLAVEAGGSTGLWDYIHSGANLDDPEIAWLHERMIATTSGNLWGGARILLDQSDEVDALKNTGVPTLISHGEFDDVWESEWQRSMAERLGAQYQVVPLGSHSPQLEEPQACADVLAKFWCEHSVHVKEN